MCTKVKGCVSNAHKNIQISTARGNKYFLKYFLWHFSIENSFFKEVTTKTRVIPNTNVGEDGLLYLFLKPVKCALKSGEPFMKLEVLRP